MTASLKKRIFVTGGSGLLGWTLTRYLPHSESLFQYRQHPIPPDFPVVRLDLRDRASLAETLNQFRPNVIINTAALPDPEKCERTPQETHLVNAEMPGWLAGWADANHARLIHISTDLVFDGQQGNYRETDPPNPISVYGETKWAGECAVKSRCGNHVILRLPIMGGTSFTGLRSLNETIPLALQKHGSVNLFTDEFRSPIWADNVAEVILELMSNDFTGLLHLPGGKDYSRYEIGRLVFDHYDLPQDRLIPGKIADFTGAPPRCPDVTLSSELSRQILSTPLNDFADGFRQYLSLPKS